MYRLTILLLLSCCFSFGQIHEVGLFVGGSNAIADVGSGKYINPNDIAIGGIYKWNRSPRHSYRVSAIYSSITVMIQNLLIQEENKEIILLKMK